MKAMTALFVAALWLPAVVLGQSPIVPGKAVVGGSKAHLEAAALRDTSYPVALTSGVRLTVPALKRAASAAPIDSQDKRIRIGSNRDLATETDVLTGPRNLHWIAALDGGATTRLSVTSPMAAALRVGLTVRGLPEGAELRFFGTGPIVGPLSGALAMEATRQHGVFWTPLTEGDSQAIEIWIPANANREAVRIALESASHLDVRPSHQFKSAGPGVSQPCEQDVVCSTNGNEALSKAARSVAKLAFTENGVTYLCSGTLISDGAVSSQVPYLYTAAHCIGSQAAAATLNTFWFFDAATCGGEVGTYRQLSRGATLLYSNATTDAALVRLSERAPDGAWFSGWDASPLATGAPILALHHPAGDVKKISAGQAMAGTLSSNGASYSTASWSLGSTEGGSSGSGLFTLNGGEYYLRGGLRGGSASCSSTGHLEDPSNRDYYSRIDLEAATLRTWLSGAPMPMDDYTGMWSNPAEPGWGMTIVQAESNHVFVVLFVQDAAGQSAWFALSEGAWRTAAVLEGRLYRATGAAFAQAYDRSKFALSAVGDARIEFDANDGAVLTVTIDGLTTVKAIRRLSL